MQATIQFRIDGDLKKSVDGIVSQFGITTNDAIKMFLTTVSRTESIPLDLSLNRYNPTLKNSIEEAHNIINHKVNIDGYRTFDDLHNSLMEQ